jgi:1-hydroxycarotenoid 3,4-desaturase
VPASARAARRAVRCRRQRRERSLSALTICLRRASATGFPLVRHNVFFSADYAREFSDEIGRERRMPEDPTIYVCARGPP